MQRIHFWGGLFGLLFTLMIGVQFWAQSGPWRVIDADLTQEIIAIQIDEDNPRRLTQEDWDEAARRQFGTRLVLGNVLDWIIGIALTSFSMLGVPVWIASRSRLDRLPDTARARRVIVCWVGLPVLMCVWVMSYLIAAVT